MVAQALGATADASRILSAVSVRRGSNDQSGRSEQRRFSTDKAVLPAAEAPSASFESVAVTLPKKSARELAGPSARPPLKSTAFANPTPLTKTLEATPPVSLAESGRSESEELPPLPSSASVIRAGRPGLNPLELSEDSVSAAAATSEGSISWSLQSPGRLGQLMRQVSPFKRVNGPVWRGGGRMI